MSSIASQSADVIFCNGFQFGCLSLFLSPASFASFSSSFLLCKPCSMKRVYLIRFLWWVFFLFVFTFFLLCVHIPPRQPSYFSTSSYCHNFHSYASRRPFTCFCAQLVDGKPKTAGKPIAIQNISGQLDFFLLVMII